MDNRTLEPSPELYLALREAQLVPSCERCRRRKGLCRAHEWEILPKLDDRLIAKLRKLMAKAKREEQSAVEVKRAVQDHTKSARRMAALTRSVNGRRARGGTYTRRRAITL